MSSRMAHWNFRRISRTVSASPLSTSERSAFVNESCSVVTAASSLIDVLAVVGPRPR